MMKAIRTLLETIFSAPAATDRDDPLAHPAIQAMSPRELADLPLPRGPRPSAAGCVRNP